MTDDVQVTLHVRCRQSWCADVHEILVYVRGLTSDEVRARLQEASAIKDDCPSCGARRYARAPSLWEAPLEPPPATMPGYLRDLVTRGEQLLAEEQFQLIRDQNAARFDQMMDELAERWREIPASSRRGWERFAGRHGIDLRARLRRGRTS